jgi:hypothetical protein
MMCRVADMEVMWRCWGAGTDLHRRFSRGSAGSIRIHQQEGRAGVGVGAGAGAGVGEVLVLVQWCWCREVVQSRRKGAEVQNGKQRCRGVEVLRCWVGADGQQRWLCRRWYCRRW